MMMTNWPLEMIIVRGYGITHKVHGDDDNNQQRNDPPRRKGRGPTKLNDIVVYQRTHVPPIHVDFDDDMNPIGEVCTNFVSYVGFVVRNQISILDNDWWKVNKDIKDQCWSDILKNFDVLNIQLLKDFWLGEGRKMWKNFKNTLTRDYVFGNKQGQDPGQTYSNIDPETWKKFVESRLDEKFKKESEKQKK